MNKQEFINELRIGLTGLPGSDVEEHVGFYSEMIDDRVEDGLTEEAAVAEIGPADRIVKQVLIETPLPKIIKERVTPKRGLRAWEIVLLVLGFPVWFPLLMAAIVIVLSIYIVIWAVVISLWAVFVSFAAGVFCGAAGFIFFLVTGAPVNAFVMLGAGVMLAGLTILMFFVCKAASKAAVILGKGILLGIKGMFVRK